MKFFIVSYLGGMFGEFFCSLLSKNKMFQVSDDIIDIHLYKSINNRWLFPNYLSIVNFDSKTFNSNNRWEFTQTQKDILINAYKGKNILVPTHWYQNDLSNIDLPTQGIRLYIKDTNILLLSYILFWIKSHIFANKPWSNRVKEIQFLIDNNHKYASKFEHLLIDGNYQNWKYLSYVSEWLVNGEPDLSHYVLCHWHRNQRFNQSLSSHWYNLDIGNLISGNEETLNSIEKDFSIELDRTLIDVYNKENISLVENELKIPYKDLANNWHPILIKYISEKLEY